MWFWLKFNHIHLLIRKKYWCLYVLGVCKCALGSFATESYKLDLHRLLLYEWVYIWKLWINYRTFCNRMCILYKLQHSLLLFLIFEQHRCPFHTCTVPFMHFITRWYALFVFYKFYGWPLWKHVSIVCGWESPAKDLKKVVPHLTKEVYSLIWLNVMLPKSRYKTC